VTFFVLMPFGTLQAGEAAVDPSDNGIDVLQDSTVDMDSRSSETTAAAELIDPGPTREYAGPIANAVDDATGKAEPLRILCADITPGTSQRLSWSATELFEGVPVSTPVLVLFTILSRQNCPVHSLVFPSSMFRDFGAVRDIFLIVVT